MLAKDIIGCRWLVVPELAVTAGGDLDDEVRVTDVYVCRSASVGDSLGAVVRLSTNGRHLNDDAGNGGVTTAYRVGQPVLIRDHISLTAQSPLVGATFVDLTDLYSKRIRAIMKSADSSLQEGVYVHWRGPTYETPAEIHMMRTLGADLVGMSTVPEAIAAHALGAEVLGISLVTNAAAGVTGEKLNHEEVIAAGKAAASSMGELLAKTIPKIV